MSRDLSRAELFELWERNKDRPQFVREYRDAIAEHTSDGVTLPPADGSTFKYREFLNDYKGTVTRQLNDDEPGTDPHDGETDNPDGSESEV